MYRLRADALVEKSRFIASGQTKQEVKAKMYEHLEKFHPDFVGHGNIQRLAELDALMNLHIEEYE
jgi:hypothetical protein